MRYEKALQAKRPSLPGAPFHDTDIVTHTCPKCGSQDLVKKDMITQACTSITAKTARATAPWRRNAAARDARAQVTHSVLEQVSLRGIEGIFGLSRRTVEFTTNLLPKWDIQRTDLIGQVAFCLGDHLDG